LNILKLLVVCLTYEILFMKILDFSNIWVFVRTSTNFAHLASFQVIELMDRPVLKTLDIWYVRQAKTKLSLQNAAFWNCCLRRTSRRFNSHPQFPRFPLGPPRTVPRTLTPIWRPRKRTICIF